MIEPGTVTTGAVEASPAYLPDDGSYGPLAAQLGSGTGDASTAEEVALAVAAAIEEDGGPLRRVVGAGATQLLDARATMDDDAFDATVRQVLHLDW